MLFAKNQPKSTKMSDNTDSVFILLKWKDNGLLAIPEILIITKKQEEIKDYFETNNIKLVKPIGPHKINGGLCYESVEQMTTWYCYTRPERTHIHYFIKRHPIKEGGQVSSNSTETN